MKKPISHLSILRKEPTLFCLLRGSGRPGDRCPEHREEAGGACPPPPLHTARSCRLALGQSRGHHLPLPSACPGGGNCWCRGSQNPSPVSLPPTVPPRPRGSAQAENALGPFCGMKTNSQVQLFWKKMSRSGEQRPTWTSPLRGRRGEAKRRDEAGRRGEAKEG